LVVFKILLNKKFIGAVSINFFICSPFAVTKNFFLWSSKNPSVQNTKTNLTRIQINLLFKILLPGGAKFQRIF